MKTFARNRLAGAAVALAAAGLLAGCDDRKSPDGGPAPTTAATASTPPGGNAGTAGTSNQAGAAGSGGGSAGATGTAGGAAGSGETRTGAGAAGSATGNTAGAAGRTPGATAPAGSELRAATAASAAARPANPASGVGAGIGVLAMADRNFISTAVTSGMFEHAAAKLAVDKASDPAVKAFAQMLLRDHAKANERLRELARKHGIELPAALPAPKQEELGKLQQASGAAFDRRFVRQVGIVDHQADIRTFEKAGKDAKDTEIKAFALKTLPTLKAHLDKAKMLPGGGDKAKTTSRVGPMADPPAYGGDIVATGPGGVTTATASGAPVDSLASGAATPPAPELGR